MEAHIKGIQQENKNTVIKCTERKNRYRDDWFYTAWVELGKASLLRWRVAPENDARIIVLVQFFISSPHIRNHSTNQITGNSLFRGSFDEGPEKFYQPQSSSSISNLMITVVYLSLFLSTD